MAPRNAYADGWNETKKIALEKIVIPKKIKCKDCDVVRLQTAYSKKRLDQLRHLIYQYGEKPLSAKGDISCRGCTAGVVVELECSVCEETKGLEGFSKVQRRNPDEARCLNCVQEHLDTEPGMGYADDDDDLQSTIQGHANTHSTLASLHNLSIGKPASEVGKENSKEGSCQSEVTGNGRNGSKIVKDADSDDNDDGNVWVEQGKRPRTNTSKDGGISYTGYDSQGQAHSRVRTPSVATSAAGSVAGSSWSASGGNPQPINTRSIGGTSTGNPGFAKIKAYKPPKSEKQKQEIVQPHNGDHDDFEDDDEEEEWI